MKDNSKRIAVVGAGLVGSLMAIYLAKRGYAVSVFERRPDMRTSNSDQGRSINLALSNRGIRALEEVGLADELKKVAIPMHGRTMHDLQGRLSFLPYGRQGQFINSISRSNLNTALIHQAEQLNVKFFFDHRCVNVNLTETSLELQHINTSTRQHVNTLQHFDLIIGADGAFSAVRWAMQMTDRFDLSQDYIEHGYKEFHIPPGTDGRFLLEKNSLHIWPRESFMMIALPNPDGSFTCTLFFPFEGDVSFSALKSDQQILEFFQEMFPDILPLMPKALDDFKSTPPSSLVTIQCFPWVRHNTFLIGDAAHAIVPFYGQGMNAGFEDCRVLNQLLDHHKEDWAGVLSEFQQLRKPDADAIAQLALDNFVEMRDLVADEDFLLRKKIEARLNELYPDRWIPLYSMVTFHEQVRYSEAYETGRKQKRIMDQVMMTPGIAANWTKLNFEAIVSQL